MKKYYKSCYHKLREEQGFIIVSNKELELFFLDSVSANIYRNMQERKSLEEIVDIIINEYNVDRTTLSRDIQEMIEFLLERKLVEVCDE